MIALCAAMPVRAVVRLLNPVPTAVMKLLLVLGVTTALIGPGGQECSTPRECKILAARTRAMAKEKGAGPAAKSRLSHRHARADEEGRAQNRRKRVANTVMSGNDPAVKHTARFACAIVLVSGPNGLRFQSEAHVQRFRNYAQGCVVYVSAAPHFRRRAMAIAEAHHVSRYHLGAPRNQSYRHSSSRERLLTILSSSLRIIPP